MFWNMVAFINKKQDCESDGYNTFAFINEKQEIGLKCYFRNLTTLK